MPNNPFQNNNLFSDTHHFFTNLFGGLDDKVFEFFGVKNGQFHFTPDTPLGKFLGILYALTATFVVINALYQVGKFLIKNDKPPFRDLMWDLTIQGIICGVLLNGGNIVESLANGFLELKKTIFVEGFGLSLDQIDIGIMNFGNALYSKSGWFDKVGAIVLIVVIWFASIPFILNVLMTYMSNQISMIILLYLLPLIIFLFLFKKLFKEMIGQYIQSLICNVLTILLLSVVLSNMGKFIEALIKKATETLETKSDLFDFFIATFLLCCIMLIGTIIVNMVRSIAEKITRVSIDMAVASGVSSAGRAVGSAVGREAKALNNKISGKDGSSSKASSSSSSSHTSSKKEKTADKVGQDSAQRNDK